MTTDASRWQIRDSQDDWEFDWRGSDRFHMRLFRSLSMREKLEAVENMCRIVDTFKGKASKRRHQDPS